MDDDQVHRHHPDLQDAQSLCELVMGSLYDSSLCIGLLTWVKGFAIFVVVAISIDMCDCAGSV